MLPQTDWASQREHKVTGKLDLYISLLRPSETCFVNVTESTYHKRS